MFTFEDLEKLVEEAKAKGISSTDTVAFRCEDETGQHPSVVFIVKGGEVEPQTSIEGNATSIGGTFWLYGTEY